MKSITTSLLFLFISVATFAQTKVGTVDSDYVLASLPELTEVQTNIETYGGELDSQFKEMVANYQVKVEEFQGLGDTVSDADKKGKQDVIVGIEQDIQKFRQNSQQLIQIRRDELMRPLYTKIGTAIDAVAKKQGYTQVLTLGNGVAYFDPAHDLTQAVADNLKITLKQ
ncbi:OmpH family outer membrane protein [Flavimarina sp. Hel_I_48]|uniref:OmpH family outer membrane protein n=1 Tax=Flavimarina sp. Hel_I_48 TaxID=1392488 RepID=UPI0004DF8D3F|nr:OmpH family outer membrane protein [Flavimarina sp. Hel_I_48]